MKMIAKNNKIMQLERLACLLDSYEGRDKLSKILQYLTLLLKSYFCKKQGKLDTAQNLGELSNGFRDARKLFSLFRSLDVIDKIIKMFVKNNLW